MKKYSLSSTRFKQFWIYTVFIAVVLIVDDLIGFKARVREVFVYEEKPEETYTVEIQPCRYLLNRAKERITWAEDIALQDTPIQDHLLASNVTTSKITLIGGTLNMKVNDVIQVKIMMHDGYGKPKDRGGDLIRVWLKDKSRAASAAAHVTDYGNGTYVATVKMFWAGTVELVMSLISSREIISTYFRRRYTCPQTVHDTAVFVHPKEDISEETLCNTEPFVPGYDVICNLTLENYGHAWYCGKPRNKRLLCNDWSFVNDKNMWNLGLEQSHLTRAEEILLRPVNRAVLFPDHWTIHVSPGANKTRHTKQPCTKCSDVSIASTWKRKSPIGYFFNKTWISNQCRGPPNDTYLASCLRDTTILLIGDSTLRQFHSGIQRKSPCVFVTDSWSKTGKHRPVTCFNTTLNFTLTWAPHGLPFSTKGTPRQYLRPISTYLNEIESSARYIIVIHTYAHLLSYHSSVFRNLMKTVRKSVQDLLNRQPTIKVIIKGPHTWGFEKASYQTMWMIDAYAKVYQDIIQEEFRMLQDKVMFLDCLDMTIATENSHIHVSENTVQQLIDQMFHYTCQY